VVLPPVYVPDGSEIKGLAGISVYLWVTTGLGEYNEPVATAEMVVVVVRVRGVPVKMGDSFVGALPSSV
jgi:hypothetical protein